MENAGPGSRGTGYGVTGCGKHRVWKTRGLVENTGSGGKHGVLVENTGLSRKHGVQVQNRGGTIISPNNEVEILIRYFKLQ